MGRTPKKKIRTWLEDSFEKEEEKQPRSLFFYIKFLFMLIFNISNFFFAMQLNVYVFSWYVVYLFWYYSFLPTILQNFLNELNSTIKKIPGYVFPNCYCVCVFCTIFFPIIVVAIGLFIMTQRLQIFQSVKFVTEFVGNFFFK